MMTSDFIIDATEANFEFEVLSYSQNTPVVVDFWAEWCRPCKVFSPMVERLAMEGNGVFRLARVDVDANPNLALRYGVRSLPTIKVFSGGDVVAELVGAQPENRLVEFISKITPPSPLSLALEKASSLLAVLRWKEAETIFRLVLEEAPNEPRALFGLAKALLAQGQGYDALYLLRDFPPSRFYTNAEILQPLAEAFVSLKEKALPEENDLDTAYINCLRLAARGNIEAGIDGLLDILRQDRRYRGNLARQTMLALLELLGEENVLTRQYRSELASILF